MGHSDQCLEDPESLRNQERISCIEETAKSLAADRRTGLLPILLAQTIFVCGWFIAFIRATGIELGERNWINIEAHSIAFSSQFFAFITAVFLSSLIGSSQSELAIPRILNRFLHEIQAIDDMCDKELTRVSSEQRRRQIETTIQERIESGSLYSWHVARWKTWKSEYGLSNPYLQTFLAITAVASGTFVAVGISSRVPERSWCRPASQLALFGVWLLSFIIGTGLNQIKSYRARYWFTLIKDFISASLIVCVVLVTQWGILHRCSCYNSPGSRALTLPLLANVAEILEQRIRGEYKWVVISGIMFQLLMCAMIAWYYQDALRVYLQRDDGLSNFDVTRLMNSRRTAADMPLLSNEREENSPYEHTPTRRFTV